MLDQDINMGPWDIYIYIWEKTKNQQWAAALNREENLAEKVA